MTSYLNRAAFAQPGARTLRQPRAEQHRGPGFWTIDLALSRLVLVVDAAQNLELRVEAFNLLNNFNWGNPITNLNSGNFGRIQTKAGDPRIMQFGVKYAF